MSVVVVGCTLRTTDLDVLERAAVTPDDARKALRSLLELEHVLEAVVLSTCNRVEVYAHVSRFHPGLGEVRAWLADRADITVEQLDDIGYAHYDEHAAAHLFRVAAGLESMVVGEQQIALQVKQAMEAARHEGTARRVLQRLFRQAIRTGRRVRRDTAITSGASSMVDVGLDEAASRFADGLDRRAILVVGAGKIGGLAADRLGDRPGPTRVWNRNRDKAERLATRTGAEVVPETELLAAVAASDLVVCTTGASEPILDADLVSQAAAGRDEPLVLLDLAMPRNVDPAAAGVDGVVVIDIEDIRERCTREITSGVLEAAQAIVDAEVHRFSAWTRAIEVDPTIAALRARAEGVRADELERLSNRLDDLDERSRETVEIVTRGIINTLLHHPSIRLKELADAGGAEHYANALRELFDLDE